LRSAVSERTTGDDGIAEFGDVPCGQSFVHLWHESLVPIRGLPAEHYVSIPGDYDVVFSPIYVAAVRIKGDEVLAGGLSAKTPVVAEADGIGSQKWQAMRLKRVQKALRSRLDDAMFVVVAGDSEGKPPEPALLSAKLRHREDVQEKIPFQRLSDFSQPLVLDLGPPPVGVDQSCLLSLTIRNADGEPMVAKNLVFLVSPLMGWIPYQGAEHRVPAGTYELGAVDPTIRAYLPPARLELPAGQSRRFDFSLGKLVRRVSLRLSDEYGADLMDGVVLFGEGERTAHRQVVDFCGGRVVEIFMPPGVHAFRAVSPSFAEVVGTMSVSAEQDRDYTIVFK
jgi:hypothetical protein